ncbi:hypothetical protein ACIHEJ_33480 [Streptomyces sp. NPDC052301]|uniref:hypothetical protein n=1 Tax=Streptomyces sp. NPDC052301 TaxID=3365687 RepID=UPI0037CD3199
MSDVTTTDLYEVTMAMSYLREDMWAPATFSLFARHLPPGRGFLVAKVTAPGRKQVFRRPGRPDVIALVAEEPPDSAQPLLRTVMRGGRRTWSPDHWQDARRRFREDVAGLPGSARRIESPEPVPPVRSDTLERLTASVRAGIEARLRPEHRTPCRTRPAPAPPRSQPPDTDR